MENSLLNLYVKMHRMPDRRQQQIPVTEERRSGEDRRLFKRPAIDPKLKRDLEEIRKTFAVFQPHTDKFIRSNSGIISKDLAIATPAPQVRDDDKKNVILEAFGDAIPSTRRILSVKSNKDNPIKAMGFGLIGLINLKEDLRDLLSIIGLSKTQAPKGYFARFKFFAGTFVENLLKKFECGQNFLDNVDTTLADTGLGRKIHLYFKINPKVKVFHKEVKYPFLSKEKLMREYIELKNGSFIGKLSCLTLNRITKIGLIAAILLEMPEIIKNIRERKDYKQIPKSVFNVASCTFLGALTSSFLTILTGSPAGSVIGLGLGLFIGNQLNKIIFNSK